MGNDPELDEIRDAVIDTITYELGCEGGFPIDDPISKLGCDPLDAIGILMALEHRFKIAIEDGAFTEESSTNDILSIVLAEQPVA